LKLEVYQQGDDGEFDMFWINNGEGIDRVVDEDPHWQKTSCQFFCGCYTKV
jgi:hypothetical protein